MDFSALATLLSQERQKMCQWQSCHSLALQFPWRSLDVKAGRTLLQGQETLYAQLDEAAVCLLHKHVRTHLPSISYVALTMTYPRIR